MWIGLYDLNFLSFFFFWNSFQSKCSWSFPGLLSSGRTREGRTASKCVFVDVCGCSLHRGGNSSLDSFIKLSTLWKGAVNQFYLLFALITPLLTFDLLCLTDIVRLWVCLSSYACLCFPLSNACDFLPAQHFRGGTCNSFVRIKTEVHAIFHSFCTSRKREYNTGLGLRK